MALFHRRRAGVLRGASHEDGRHLAEFAETRPGIEAYLEPRTSVTDTTVVLVAASGEWTRRRVGGTAWAQSFARRHRVPLYDAAAVGYPRRMREWSARHGSRN